MCAVPHTGWALVALAYGGVQNNPHMQALCTPGYSGLYTAPLYGGVLFEVASGMTYSALHQLRHRALQEKEVNLWRAYYLRALVFIISCALCVWCEK